MVVAAQNVYRLLRFGPPWDSSGPVGPREILHLGIPVKHLPPILVIDDNQLDQDLLSLVIKGAFGDVAIETAGDAASIRY